MKKYTYSFDGEFFYDEFDSIDEAIDQAKEDYDEEEPLKEVYVGEAVPFVAHIFADDVIEQIISNAYNEVNGECVGDYLNDVPEAAVNELEKDLNEVYEKWEKKHGMEPEFSKVINVNDACARFSKRVEDGEK